MTLDSKIHPVTGKVRHYDWGGKHFIPELLGTAADGRPWAEYWLGAHPSDPAQITVDGQDAPLDTLIAQSKTRWLGDSTAREFGELPYLMKILDVAKPLSIQVHPDLQQAKLGFERENAEGLAMDAAQRNFKDPNHKPELALALSPFCLLFGFRPIEEILQALAGFPSLSALRSLLESQGLKAFFSAAMNANPDQLGEWVLPLWEACSDTADDTHAHYWIRRWRSMHESDEAALDRGVLAFLFMNLVKLKPGESIYQGANVPHAYLSGQCVEVMANSDNVLRGGLTPKHVDPQGLTDHIRFDPGSKFPMTPPTDLREFRLTCVNANVPQTSSYQPSSLAFALNLGDECSVGGASVKRGQCVVIEPGAKVDITRPSADSMLVLADQAHSLRA